MVKAALREGDVRALNILLNDGNSEEAEGLVKHVSKINIPGEVVNRRLEIEEEGGIRTRVFIIGRMMNDENGKKLPFPVAGSGVKTCGVVVTEVNPR